MTPRTLLLAITTTAVGAAVAFEATHVVVTDDATVYDELHPYEDAYVIASPPYWTLAHCETVGTPQSYRTYCYVTLPDGVAGLAEWEYFGKLVVARAALTLATGPGGDQPAAAVPAGELLARVGEENTPAGETWLEVVTADRRRGWVRAADAGPYTLK